METKMMMMLAAFSIYHSMHTVMEMKSVRYKLNKIAAKAGGTPFKEKSFKIDSTGKMMGMMAVMMGMFIALPFFIFKMMDVPMPMLVNMSLMLIMIAEIVTTMGYNNFHKQVGEVIGKIK
jgi:hypothetical protein